MAASAERKARRITLTANVILILFFAPLSVSALRDGNTAFGWFAVFAVVGNIVAAALTLLSARRHPKD
jgi:Na+/melibiose symporter-like transporter